jgi:hypothetical protein
MTLLKVSQGVLLEEIIGGDYWRRLLSKVPGGVSRGVVSGDRRNKQGASFI